MAARKSPIQALGAFVWPSRRLVLPVSLLLVLLGAAYLYADAFLPLVGMPARSGTPGWPFSDLILPCAGFRIHLTNRRYGPGYAFAPVAGGAW